MCQNPLFPLVAELGGWGRICRTQIAIQCFDEKGGDEGSTYASPQWQIRHVPEDSNGCTDLQKGFHQVKLRLWSVMGKGEMAATMTARCRWPA